MNAPGLETVPLLEEPQTSSATKNRNFWKVGIAAVVSGGIGLAIFVGALTLTPSKKSAATSFVEATVGGIKFTAWNSEYASSESEKNYPFLNDANVPLVEPHRATTLSFVSPARKLKSCSSTIVLLAGGGAWDDIPGVTKAASWRPSFAADADTTTGEIQLEVNFPAPGKYQVSSTLEFVDGGILLHFSTVNSYYVRREIRSLTPKDRMKFFDAFLIMAKTPKETGQKKYGRHFRTIDSLDEMHLEMAAGREIDHLHDGLGFITQHIAITSEFELSLQSISPALTVPFWDYTIDATKVEVNSWNGARPHDVGSIFNGNSVLFTDEYFGATDEREHTVTEGRFAYQEVPRNYKYATRSPYGYLRAPWNLNPSKYVTRYHKTCSIPFTAYNDTDLSWPSCADHFRMTNTNEFNGWYQWVWEVAYKPHGPVHSWVGGVGGACGEWDKLADKGLLNDHEVAVLKMRAFLLLKAGWRAEAIEAPSFCSRDTPTEDCTFKFVAGNNESPDIAVAILKTLIGQQVTTVGSSWNSLNDTEKTHIVSVIFGDAWWPGDHLEAGSPIVRYMNIFLSNRS